MVDTLRKNRLWSKRPRHSEWCNAKAGLYFCESCWTPKTKKNSPRFVAVKLSYSCSSRLTAYVVKQLIHIKS